MDAPRCMGRTTACGGGCRRWGRGLCCRCASHPRAGWGSGDVGQLVCLRDCWRAPVAELGALFWSPLPSLGHSCRAASLMTGPDTSMAIPLLLFQTGRRPDASYVDKWQARSPGLSYAFLDHCNATDFLRHCRSVQLCPLRASLRLALASP